MLATFSRMNMRGMRFCITETVTKNSSPPCPSNPVFCPRYRFVPMPKRLNGWHGNPAVKTSCSGMSPSGNSARSCAHTWPSRFLKFSEYVRRANLSVSAEKNAAAAQPLQSDAEPADPAVEIGESKSVKTRCHRRPRRIARPRRRTGCGAGSAPTPARRIPHGGRPIACPD